MELLKEFKVMKNIIRKQGYTSKCLATAMLLSVLSITAHAEYSVTHTFTINDIQGDFQGNIYQDDKDIICTTEPCPGEAQPFTDKSGVKLFPVDSEFGFVVSDFVGAAQKTRNMDYAEGWVGNIGDPATGVMISNANTDTFKVKYPMGSWCAGLGANTVKCSTEHYTVLEHLMTCYETVPYMFADPASGEQGELIDPETGLPIGTCDLGKLNNDLYVVVDGLISDELLAPGADGKPDLPANESTVRNDIAVNTDYAITKKDDGKPLYRFGNLIKRPNDVRLYAKMALPEAWKAEGADIKVTRAELIVKHWVTNNPNDQIRPEDMENEGAIGRLPRFIDDGSGYWTSSVECYEGDGDLIEAGTTLKNPDFAIPAPVQGSTDNNDPYAYSDDLLEALTNGWYTTTDREPFEWSYDSNGDGSVDASSSGPDETLGTLLSGPRWRLKPNKFGQDIPGLEIPVSDDSGNPGCIPVPYTSENIKYSVGDETITTINLLDFEEGIASPLLSSKGWVDASQNFVNIGVDGSAETGNGISINGLPLTEDFDLAVYVKGDKKPTSLYTATLVIECEQGCDDDLMFDEGDFVEHYYLTVLAREPDEGGFIFYVDALVNNDISGSDLALSFFLGDEFIARDLSDEDFIDTAYLALFGRAADAEGKDYWLQRLANGASRQKVLRDLMTATDEFADFCATFGVIPF